MTDAEYLFLIVLGIYLAEATFWARAGMFVFARQFWGLGLRRVNLRWALLRNENGGILMGNVFPWGQASICQQWPVSLSPQGVYGFVSQSLSSDGRPRSPERFVRFEDISSVHADGLNLLINNVHFAPLASLAGARRLAETIRELAKLKEEERGPAIESALAQHLNSAAVREQFEEFRVLTAELKITCMLVMFIVFILWPVLAYFKSDFSLGTFLGCYFGLVLLAMMQYVRAHRRLYPEERLERWKHALMVMISPADAVHARDHLGRQLLGLYSPLAVARVVSSPESFREFAAEVWRDLEHPVLPVCPAFDAGPRETEAWFRDCVRRQFRRFLSDAQVEVDGMLSPPAPDGPFSLSYCPRCLGQYEMEAGTCADCGDRPLVSLPHVPG